VASYIATIAEAVKDALNAADPLFSGAPAFTAERVYSPQVDYATIEDETTLVLVFAGTSERSQETRTTVRSDVEVRILFAHKIDQLTQPNLNTANAAVDEMLEFGEALADAIVPGTRYGGHPCLRVLWEPVVDLEKLQSHRVFVGLITAFFYRSP
jgi:hypothetical protein